MSRVRNNNGQTWSAFGINLGGRNNHVVQNNFCFDVRMKMIKPPVQERLARSLALLVFGVAIRTRHKVYHNSVDHPGTVPGTTRTHLTAGLLIASTASDGGIDVRNNIFANTLSGGNPTSPEYTSCRGSLPSGEELATLIYLHNNDYVEGTDVK